ncbi:MAG TPA: carboxypeptidase-like regulatory domain-containing protein [Longimicrobium sp.]|nr:carboxypeptidase-like regulatory domain-containing protein [Longimicrobium sp.]
MRIRTTLPRLAALAAILLAAAPAAAQSVRGQVVEPGTGQPVTGAVVILLDASGNRVTATLTDAQGGFAMRGGGAGTYSLRAERVGYETVTSPAMSIVADEAPEQRLVMAPRQVVLEPLLVTGTQRECTIRPQAEAAVVWEEVRKALDAASVADEARRHAFRKRLIRRDRTLYSRRTYNQQEWTSREFSTEPFHATPVHRLAQYGYLERAAGDSLVFHAPDANTLLSDAFLDHHCFRLRERRGSVGLEFAPTADRRVADVRGILWMDARTGRLRKLEDTYVNLPWENPEDVLGGELGFEQLEDGAWIVRRWVVRMPRLRAADDGTTYVAGIVEQVGDIVAIQPRP